jgi:cobalt-zinc-cadmium efflux system outer membrane protein
VHVQEAQEAQVRQQVLLDVQSAYLALQLARRTVETYHDGIVPRSEALLERTEQGYKLGASTILDLIDAQETYRTTITSYNSSIGDYRQAVAQLERAIGAPVPTMPR